MVDELRRRPALRADGLAGRMRGVGLERDEAAVLDHRDGAAAGDAERAVALDALDHDDPAGASAGAWAVYRYDLPSASPCRLRPPPFDQI
jgi:hypothetical protein